MEKKSSYGSEKNIASKIKVFNNGKDRIYVSKDLMQVVLEITNDQKSTTDRKKTLREVVVSYFSENKIKSKLKEEELSAAIANKETGTHKYVLAEGKAVFLGSPRKVKIFLSDKPTIAPFLSGQGTPEEQKIDNLKQVKKGELIGEETAASLPRYGENLFGIPMPAPKLRDSAPLPGKNILKKAGKLYSEIDGVLAFGKGINVMPAQIVNKSMNRVSGEVSFDGAIIVNGVVRGCDKVKCRLLACKSISGTEVEAEEDIISLQEITDCKIKSGGSIYANQIIATEAKSRGDVVVTNSIDASKIYSSGKVTCSKQGIYESVIHAKHFVDTKDLGDSSGKKLNDITIGIDPTIRKKLNFINDSMEKEEFDKVNLENTLRLEKTKLKGKNEEINTAPSIIALLNKISSINKKVKSLEDRKNILLKNINQNKHLVYLRVRGKAQAGNSVSSANASVILQAPIKAFKAIEKLEEGKQNQKKSYKIEILFKC